MNRKQVEREFYKIRVLYALSKLKKEELLEVLDFLAEILKE